MSSATQTHPQHEMFSLLISILILLSAFFYFHGWLRIRSASPTLLPTWRLAMFMGGLLSLWVAVGSPFAFLDHRFLTFHMLKHLLLMTVSAPLILQGQPRWALLCGLPWWFLGRSLLLRRKTSLFHNLLDSTVFAWLAGTVTVIAWHVPGLFRLAQTSDSWHSVENLSFLCAGLLFWRPIVGLQAIYRQRPQWSIALFLFLATLPCDVLAAFLLFCGHVIYGEYLTSARPFRVSPLQDQEYAGAIMWVWVTFAYMIPAILIAMRILAPSGGRYCDAARDFDFSESSGRAR